MTDIHTGGCQCGAVRYRVEGELEVAGSAIAACARRRAAIGACPSSPYPQRA